MSRCPPRLFTRDLAALEVDGKFFAKPRRLPDPQRPLLPLIASRLDGRAVRAVVRVQERKEKSDIADYLDFGRLWWTAIGSTWNANNRTMRRCMRGSLKKGAVPSSPRVRSVVVETAATGSWSGRRLSRRDLARLRRLPIEKGIAAQKIQALVQVERVSKRYETAIALDELTLDVFEGETLGLLGPNGAGKTTLMHLLAGLLRPDTGIVRIAGLGDPQSRRVRAAIGLAPQELAVYPQLSAEENLRFFGRLYGLRGAELQAGVEKALRLADLTARAGNRAGTFSGGMKRRLNLACALVHRPTLLLLDEPTAGIDPHSRNRLFEVIERLKSEGLTLVYSTHLMEEPERLCDRVAIIDHGHLLAVGKAPQLVERHGAADLHALFLALTGSEVRD